jgi:hypothetical protein
MLLFFGSMTSFAAQNQVKAALQAALETKELIEWMSRSQKDQVFKILRELSQLTHDVLGGQPHHSALLGSQDLEIKTMLVQLSGHYTKLANQLERDAQSLLLAPVREGAPTTVQDQIEALGVDKVTRCCTLACDAGKVFKEAALFAPVAALKTLEEGKKAAGEGMLRALGVRSQHALSVP